MEGFSIKKNIMPLFWKDKCIFQGIRGKKLIYVLCFFKDSNVIREYSILIIEGINFCSLGQNIFNVSKEVLESFSKGGWWNSQCLSSVQNQVPFFLLSLDLKQRSRDCGVGTCTWHKSSPESAEAGLCMEEQDDHFWRKQNGKEAVPNWDKWFLFILFPSLYYL